MKTIRNKADLEAFLGLEFAFLFFRSEWSQFATISQRMIEIVENSAKVDTNLVPFYSGCFEGDLLGLAEVVVHRGVPEVAFTGKGSVALFQGGRVAGFVGSVIGEGNYSVLRLLEKGVSDQTDS